MFIYDGKRLVSDIIFIFLSILSCFLVSTSFCFADVGERTNSLNVPALTMHRIAMEEAILFEEAFEDLSVAGEKNVLSTFETKGMKETGRYPETPGRILTTPDNLNEKANKFKLGHAGIVLQKGATVEAIPNGVKKKTKDWRKRLDCNQKYIRILGGDVVKTSDKLDEKVAKWCKTKIDCPYNDDFYDMKTRKKFYCSQLVWAGFKDVAGINLNTSKHDISTPTQEKHAISPGELLCKTNVNNGKVKIIYKRTRE